MNTLNISSLLLLPLSIFVTSTVVAKVPAEEINATDTIIEKYEERTKLVNGSLPPLGFLNSDIEVIEFREYVEIADTRTEQKSEKYQAQEITPDEYYRYDVRRTEAFNLVSSAYRGQFEEQGIEGYAVLVSNYNTGDLTAEDLINAAIQAGELSPKAMKDESYVKAVELQLRILTDS